MVGDSIAHNAQNQTKALPSQAGIQLTLAIATKISTYETESSMLKVDIVLVLHTVD